MGMHGTAIKRLLSGYLRVTWLLMRRANTAISELKIRGVTRYRVTYPTATGRKRELYVDKKKAEKRLKEIKEEQKRFGLSVTAMTSTTRADAVAADKILAGTGLTLVEIARAAVEKKRREESGKPISALDQLASMSGPVRDSLTKPSGPLEGPAEQREREQRERLEAELRKSFKIVIVTACTWKLADGSTFAVQPGNVLVANGSQDGNYVFTYRDSNFLIPFAYAIQSAFTEQELAARRLELQKMEQSNVRVLIHEE